MRKEENGRRNPVNPLWENTFRTLMLTGVHLSDINAHGSTPRGIPSLVPHPEVYPAWYHTLRGIYTGVTP